MVHFHVEVGGKAQGDMLNVFQRLQPIVRDQERIQLRALVDALIFWLMFLLRFSVAAHPAFLSPASFVQFSAAPPRLSCACLKAVSPGVHSLQPRTSDRVFLGFAILKPLVLQMQLLINEAVL